MLNHVTYFVIVYRFSANAFENEEVLKDPRVSALLNTSFKDLPPCLFIVADLDVLRDENLRMKYWIFSKCYSYVLEYQKLLEKAGVQTKLLLVKGVIHGYFSLPGKTIKNIFYEIISFFLSQLGIFPQACAESVNAVRDFMASI